jgi:hypothetical protein
VHQPIADIEYEKERKLTKPELTTSKNIGANKPERELLAILKKMQKF